MLDMHQSGNKPDMEIILDLYLLDPRKKSGLEKRKKKNSNREERSSTDSGFR